MSETTQTPNKPRRLRSPNYPFIGLEEAIKKAQLVLDKGGLHEVPFKTAMEAWDYKAGSTHSAIAALKAFGLVTVNGEGEKRKIQLTEAARKILKPEHPERASLLKKAVLMPTIYSELWREYKGVLPPSDSVISNYLEFDKKFNPDVIKGLIKDFRASIAYAGLDSSDKIIESEEIAEDGSGGSETVQPPINPNLSPPPPAISTTGNAGNPGNSGVTPPGGGSELRVTFSPDGKPQMVFSGVVTKGSLELLQAIVSLRPEIIESPKKEEATRQSKASDFPRQAMWRNKDHDQPVTVTGSAGEKDGKAYFTIEGSSTGVPADELEFDK